jgi:hypothetical protein
MMALFLFSCFLAGGGLLWAVNRAHQGVEHTSVRRGFPLVFGLWMAAWAAYGLSGAAQGDDASFAYFVVPMLVNLMFVVAVGASSIGARLAEQTPIILLVGFHAFRVPLEMALHGFGEQGTVPVALSWSGQNLDVFTGVLAVALLPLVRRHIAWVLLFEIVGVAMLANIFRIVITHTPGSPVWASTAEVPLVLVAYAPHNWIVSVCVFSAILGHIVIGRWLWRNWPDGEKTLA